MNHLQNIDGNQNFTWSCLPCDWDMQNGSLSSPDMIWSLWYDLYDMTNDNVYKNDGWSPVQVCWRTLLNDMSLPQHFLPVPHLDFFIHIRLNDDLDLDDNDEHGNDLHVLPHPGSLQLPDDKIHRLVLQLPLEVLVSILTIHLIVLPFCTFFQCFSFSSNLICCHRPFQTPAIPSSIWYLPRGKIVNMMNYQ